MSIFERYATYLRHLRCYRVASWLLLTRKLCSMINLMEGIIPEYDRKGKVGFTSFTASVFVPDLYRVTARSEVPLDRP